MEFVSEVNDALGKGNVRIFLDELQRGRIGKEKLKMIALQMEGSVHNIFLDKTKDGQNELVHVMKYMLDVWFKEELFKTGKDALAKFVEILTNEDIRLGYLAEKMKKESGSETASVNNGSWNIVLRADFKPEYYLLDRNDNESFLGSGSFGDVYMATRRENVENTGLPNEVAVKTINWILPAAKGSEDTEWKLIEKGLNFTNDNLTQMFYLKMTMGRRKMRNLQIFMEMCEETLEEYTARASVSLNEVKHVTVGLLKGLDHLHLQNIIHRDVKPENILLKKRTGDSSSISDMVIKLSHFNVSKWLPVKSDDATNTPRRGEAAFLAPEVILDQDDGKTRYGTACDVWAVGVLVYLLRENKALFVNEQELRSKQLNSLVDGKVKAVPEADIQAFLQACLNTDPQIRSTAGDLLKLAFLQAI